MLGCNRTPIVYTEKDHRPDKQAKKKKKMNRIVTLWIQAWSCVGPRDNVPFNRFYTI